MTLLVKEKPTKCCYCKQLFLPDPDTNNYYCRESGQNVVPNEEPPKSCPMVEVVTKDALMDEINELLMDLADYDDHFPKELTERLYTMIGSLHIKTDD
jgi:hypothetical protein